jgi:hypothetical protein
LGVPSLVVLRRLSEDLGVTGSLSDLEGVFRDLSSSSRSSVMLRDFFRDGSLVDSDGRRLGVEFDSPLRREEPAAERASASLT